MGERILKLIFIPHQHHTVCITFPSRTGVRQNGFPDGIIRIPGTLIFSPIAEAADAVAYGYCTPLHLVMTAHLPALTVKVCIIGPIASKDEMTAHPIPICSFPSAHQRFARKRFANKRSALECDDSNNGQSDQRHDNFLSHDKLYLWFCFIHFGGT